jgi:hypothetical protein
MKTLFLVMLAACGSKTDTNTVVNDVGTDSTVTTTESSTSNTATDNNTTSSSENSTTDDNNTTGSNTDDSTTAVENSVDVDADTTNNVKDVNTDN